VTLIGSQGSEASLFFRNCQTFIVPRQSRGFTLKKLTEFKRPMNVMYLQVVGWNACKAIGRINAVSASINNTEFALNGN
jgi:hypothetical protein